MLMSKLNGKELEYAVLHNSLFIVGIGDLGKNLSSKTTPTLKAVKMTVDEPFIVVEVEGSRSHKTHRVAVPITNFMLVEPKPTAPAKE